MAIKAILKGYKQTDVGIIPEEWDVVSFEELRDKKTRWSITGGPFGSNLKSEDYTRTGVRIIQLQNIGDGKFNDEYKIFTSEKKAKTLTSCCIYPNEIILSKMGDPVARACFMPDDDNLYLMASDGIRLSIDKKQYSAKFVLEYINSLYFRTRAFNASTGSTRLRIGLQILKKLFVIKPSLTEQEKISKVLSDTDNLINKLETLIEKKKNIKKGTMQELLIGKRRLEGFNEKWKIETLGNIGIFSKGKGLSKNDITNSGKLKCIPYTSIYTDFQEIIDYGQINLFTSSNDVVIVNSPHLLIAGSSNMLENVGKATAYVNNTNVAIGGDIILFKTNINVYFLSYLLSTDSHRKKIIRLSQGSTIRHVYASTFQNYEIKLPSTKEEQSGIAQTLFDMDLEIKELEKKKEKYKMIKQGMIQKLLTGEIRLQ